MTNEELEQKVKRLEEQLTELRFKILESKGGLIPYNPYEVEVPEDVDGYVYINNLGNIYDLNTLTTVGFEKIYKRGLAFKTKKEAEKYDKERKLLFKLHKWAEEHNGGWTPNWNDFEEKQYYVVYDYEDKQFYVRFEHYSKAFTKLPYLKSYNLAEQFIEEFGEEIKGVLL